MDYYIREINPLDSLLNRTAGVKARDDLESILTSLNMDSLEIPSCYEERKNANGFKKLIWHKKIADIWEEKLTQLNAGDRIFVQFPTMEHSIFLYRVFNKIMKKGIKIILFIHDLELLRVAKRTDISKAKRIRLKFEEEKILKSCDYVVVHNKKMKEFVSSLGVNNQKLISLEIFDYLNPGVNIDELPSDRLGRTKPVIIAGNLRPHKAQYAYHLPNNCEFNMYGVDYSSTLTDKIHYFGSFPSSELPQVLKGSYGLVWDGEVAETCSGVYGEYLKINNPHKTSLYLSLGIPVVIWSKAALTDFIIENKCGIVVDSLYDIHDVMENMSDDEYQQLVDNTKLVSQKICSGYFTKQAIKQCK